MATPEPGRRSMRRDSIRNARRRRRLVVALIACLSLFGLGGLQAASAPSDDSAPQISLHVSDSPDRSGSEPLDGTVLAGEQYIFVPPHPGMDTVLFYAGSPSSSTKIASEGAYPYDLAGGSKEEAAAMDVAELGTGEVTLTAVVYFRDGRSYETTARFEVNPERPVDPEPTPTTSPEPTPTVVPSPTAEPTASPTPKPTESPTPSPTRSPKPTPTPTPSPEPSETPEPDPEPEPPSDFPNADTTGVPAGTELKVVSGMTVTTPGEVLEGLDIRGCLRISADNVTVRNSKVSCANAAAAVIKVDGSNALIENVEVDGQGVTSNGIASGSFTARRVNIHGTVDGTRAGSNTVIEYSYIHHLARVEGSHNDTVQSVGGSNITIRYNNLQPYNGSTKDPMNAAYQFGSELSALRNVQVYGNLMNGGNYTVSGADGQDIVIRDNAFGRDFRYGAIRVRGAATITGNYWYDSGEPVN